MRKKLEGHLNLGGSSPMRCKARMAQRCPNMVLSLLVAGAKANITIELDAVLESYIRLPFMVHGFHEVYISYVYHEHKL